MKSQAAKVFRFQRFALFLIACANHLFFSWGVASADSLTGVFDINYTKTDSKSRDVSGATTQTQLSAFSQQYRLTLNKSFYPNLTLLGGGIFEKINSDLDSGGLQITSTDTKITPFFDLRLASPIFKAGVGYARTEDEQKTSGFSSTTNVYERSYATLGWMPESFPDWNIRLENADTFDKERIQHDTSTNQVFVKVHYAYKGFDFRYYPSYKDEINRIKDFERKEWTHNGRATYSGSFFQGRTTLSAYYEATRTETEIIANGTGEASFPLIPLFGLSALDDTPADGTLDSNPALIDGNLTASTGLNLGLPPLGGDIRPRNMGLDFLIPSETNTLYVWVDRELPPEIATVFTWEVYTSQDNRVWNLATTVAAAPFGPFQNRFEIHLPNVTSRFIKVVTRPLTSIVPRASEFPDIFVTEIQAFINRPVNEVGGKITATTQTGSVDFRMRLLDRPSLYYDFSYYTVNHSPPSRTQSNMINGFSASHAFSGIFSASGRIAREDYRAYDWTEVAYFYTASLQAVPLRTLRHVLLFSGRNELYSGNIAQLIGGQRDVYSLTTQNTAELYRGIQVFLNGGLTREKTGAGEKQETENLLFGATFVPNKTMSVTLNFNGTWTDRTGGVRPDENTADLRGDASISYRPFDTLYLLASVTRIERPGMNDTVQNYGLNWSPFPSGALQFTFDLNQDLSARDNSKVRTVHPNLRWNVTSATSLDLSYDVAKTESNTGTTDMKTLFTRLRIIF